MPPTAPTAPPSKPPPMRAPQKPAAPAAGPAQNRKFGVQRGVTRTSWKAGIHGPEGIGKSTLMAACPGVIVADLEYSTRDIDVPRATGIISDKTDPIERDAESWSNLREWIRSLTSGVACIDSMTRAEDWAAAWAIRNKKSNEGKAATDSLEDWKYKAGLIFVCDEFRRFLADIDAAFCRGVSIIMVAHTRISKVKNPDGSDFVRYEPRLIHDEKASNMLQWVQFLDHLLFIDLDKSVDKGKVTGSGSRAIYLDTSPNHVSKTRSLPTDPIEFVKGQSEARLWEMLGVKA